MKNKNDRPTGELGLAANGSSQKWYVAVDETLEGNEWSLEIDGPQTYLVFRLQNLRVVSKAMRFLQLNGNEGVNSYLYGRGEELVLGRFGSTSVSLIWDDENFSRCFLIIGPKAKSTLRLSLDAEDVRMLIEALNQVLEDLPGAGYE